MAPLIIISGPSGSGKTTLVARLLQTSRLPLRRAITATTRAPRPGERDGADYHFWSRQQFESAISEGGLLEYALVHGCDYYGTPFSEVEPFLRLGTGVILVIDVQGAAKVRQIYPEAFSIFLRVSDDNYETRLRARGDAEESIPRRLQSVRLELARAAEYNAQLINDRLDEAVTALEALIAPRFAARGGC